MREYPHVPLVCEIMRGGAPHWPGVDGSDADAFLKLCDYHGMLGLVRERIPSAWPDEIKAAADRREIARSFWETGHRQAVASAVTELSAAGVEPLILKGTALAYSLYDTPALRARGDTDILIAFTGAQAAAKALAKAGFEPVSELNADIISSQESYALTDRAGQRHVIDLHRKINNSPVLAHCFSHDELRARAIKLTKLCDDAMGLSAIDALLLGAMHRATHIHNPYYHDGAAHLGGDRLIWLYDLHLLAGALSRPDWETMWRLAEAKGLLHVTRQALRESERLFGTSVIWGDDSEKTAGEASIYLSSGRARQLWMDLLANDGLTQKVRFAIELGFPPREYLLAKYGKSASAWLPLLYARRAAEGALKRLG